MKRQLFLALAATLVVDGARSLADTAAAGSLHSEVIKTTDGTAWAWGSNTNGRLGDGTTTPRSTPVPVPSPTGLTAVAAGGGHTLFLKSNGTVWASGINTNGQLGDNTTTQRPTPVQVRQTPVSPITYLTGVTAIAAGSNFSLALKSDGTVWAWGQNNNGQLGDNTAPTQKTIAVQVLTSGGSAPLTGITAIAAGDYHALAVKSDGTVWAWGNNGNGRLGDGTTTQRTTAVQTSFAPGTVLTSVAAGSSHSLARKSDATAWAWGLNSSGQLGDGTNTQRPTPVPVNNLSSIASLSAGSAHSAAVETNGTVHTWGANANGQLGNGTTTPSNLPLLVQGISTAATVVAAENHTLAVTVDGVVWAWGLNSSSQLGDGTTENRLSPVAISDPGFVWKVATPKFAPVGNTYYANTTVTISCATPSVTIRYTTDGSEPTTDSQSGTSVSITVSTTLKAKAWRTNWPASNVGTAVYTLQVTQPTFAPPGGPYTEPKDVVMSTTTPGATIRYTTDGSNPTGSSTPYPGLPGVHVATTTTLKAAGFKAGWSDSTVRTATYTMNFGPLAAPTFAPAAGTYVSSVTVTMTAMPGATIRYTAAPTNPPNPNCTNSPIYPQGGLVVDVTTMLKALACHPDYTQSTITTGVYTIQVATPAFSPGAGSYPGGTPITISVSNSGATIHYTTNGVDPTQSDPSIVSGTSIAVGNFTLKARAFKTGCNASNVQSAVYTTSSSAAMPSVLAAGEAHSLAVAPSGAVWAWGSNFQGQLGDGLCCHNELSPIQVPATTGVVAVAAGAKHSLALKGDTTVWAWGDNADGQLGDGTTVQRKSPVQVKVNPTTFLTGVVAIAAARQHSLALKNDGTVWAWGLNDNGQLGNNTTTSSSLAVQVNGLSGVIAVAAGGSSFNFGGFWRGAGSHSLALKSDRTVWAWGGNQHGQLGDTTTTNRWTPVPVAGGLSNVVAIGAGGYHSLAVKTDGTVWAWGASANGQLGNGVSGGAEVKTPVRATGLTGATAVRGGRLFSFGLKVDGTLWAWGSNSNGQLGDGTTFTRTTPTQLPYPTSVIAMAAGDLHALARTSDDAVWAWGYSNSGQVGDGTGGGFNANRLSPVQVFDPGFVAKAGTPMFSPWSHLGYTAYNDFYASVTSLTPGATIHYTTNGVDPTEFDPVAVGGQVLVEQTATYKARAWAPGFALSNVASSSYEMAVATPSLNPGGGNFAGEVIVTLTAGTIGAQLHYTMNGAQPTQSDPWVLLGGQLLVDQTLTLKVTGFKAGYTTSPTTSGSYVWFPPTQTPEFSPGSGSYAAGQQVTISCSTPGATIHYTDTGLEPTQADPVIVSGGVVTLTKSVTLKVKAWESGFPYTSLTGIASYMVSLGTVAAPTFSLPGGSYSGPQAVTLTTTTPGATIRYTIDGSEPTLTSSLYTKGLNTKALNLDRSLTLKAKAFKWDFTASPTATASYAITVNTVEVPVLDPPSGSLPVTRYVAVSCATAGATLRYTTTGLDPTPVDPIVPPQGVLVDRAMRLKVKAWKMGSPDSPVAIGDYAVTGAVSAGKVHSLALKSDGTVWSWGGNSWGQLGNGTSGGTHPLPAPIPGGFSGVVAIAAGTEHSLALKADGTVWSWGRNQHGELGTGDLNQQLSPVAVGGGLTGVVAIAAGDYNSLALKNDGTVWAFGRYGQQTPTQIVGLTGVAAIAAGTYFAALKSDGTVWVWETSPTPLQVQGLTGLAALASGLSHRLAIRTDGTTTGAARSWGANASGQLGDGSRSAATSPVPVVDLDQAMAVAGGEKHSLAVEDDRTLWSWGDDSAGQLGDLHYTVARLIPMHVVSLSEIVGVAAGSLHSHAVKGDGTIWAWGENSDGRLGDGSTTDRPTPVQVLGLTLANNTWLYGDPDGDGLLTGREVQLGSDPFLADTNGDGITDGVALSGGLSLTDTDMDDDGVLNAAELQAGTNPFVADTDADGCPDNTDAFPLDPTRCAAPPPNPGDTTPPTITLTDPTNATLISVVPPQ